MRANWKSSHVWHKHPHLIKKEKLTRQQVNLEPILSPFVHQDLLGKSGDTIEVFWNSREQKAFAPSGSFSDSSKASPEKGKRIPRLYGEEPGEVYRLAPPV